MINYTHLEPIETCYREIDELVKEYFATTIAKVNTPPLDFNWDVYTRAQEEHVLELITARDGNELVGLATYFKFMHPHHKTLKCAQSDLLAVRLSRRGFGIGRMLVLRGEEVLGNDGVQIVSHQHRTCYDTEPLFTKLGYKLEEQSYRKVL